MLADMDYGHPCVLPMLPSVSESKPEDHPGPNRDLQIPVQLACGQCVWKTPPLGAAGCP